mgnify:CR=1 FL=1|jgi:mannosyltransferase OCH1-like enzyme
MIYIILLLILLLNLYNYYKQFSNQIIEKNIFQFSYHNYNELPKEYKNNINKLKRDNPEYNYKYFQVGSVNDNEVNNFILKNYGENILNIYNNINNCYGVVKADFFRYLVIYKKGGIYLDIKSSLNKPLREIINNTDEYILTSWISDSILQKSSKTIYSRNFVNTKFAEYPQWYIISRSNHPFLQKVIEKCIYNLTYPMLTYGTQTVLMTCGPIMYTNIIYPIRKKYNFTFRKNKYNNLLQYSIHKNNDHFKYYKNNYRNCNKTIMKNNIFKLDGIYIKNVQTKKQWLNIWNKCLLANIHIQYFSRLKIHTDNTLFTYCNNMIKDIILIFDINVKIPIFFWEKVNNLITHNNWDIIILNYNSNKLIKINNNNIKLNSYIIKRNCYKNLINIDIIKNINKYNIYGCKIL